jgi:drug/metabolite transporter (DMT)-like permease
VITPGVQKPVEPAQRAALSKRPGARGSRGLVLYVLLCVIWGSTWLVIKIGYGGLGPFNVAALRFFIAAAFLAAIVPLVGARWPQGREQWGLVLWVGLVLFGADYGLIYWGEQFIDSGLTAILFATLPLITVVLAHVYIPGDRLSVNKLVGTLLAFVGVVALFGDHVRVDASKTGPMLAIVGSAVCAAAAGVVTKRHGGALHPAAFNAPAMFVGAIVLWIASLAAGDRFQMPRDLWTWAAVLYLAVAGSVVTFLAYFSLLKTWSVTSMSFISVFTPAIALGLGFAVLGERPTLLTALGAGLILSGVAIAVTRGRPAALGGVGSQTLGVGPRPSGRGQGIADASGRRSRPARLRKDSKPPPNERP